MRPLQAQSPTGLRVALALSALAILALCAAPALADQNIHRFARSFTPLGGFKNPLGVAINQSTEEVYIADYSAAAVFAFEASGEPDTAHSKLTKADGTTPFPFSNPYGVAVDNSGGSDQGDIYVASYTAGAVNQFDPTGARTATPAITAQDVPVEGTPQSGGLPAVLNNGGFSPVGLAVAANGDIYVGDQSNSVVDVFESNGTFVSQLAAGYANGTNLIALDHSGDLYVTSYGNGTVEFSPSGACVNSCTPIDPAGASGVTVDKAGHVFANEGNQIAEFSSSGTPLETFAGPLGETEPFFGGISSSYGLAVNESTEKIYIADFGNSKADIFEPYLLYNAVLPAVGDTSASDLAPTTATLTAQIKPGFRPTVYRFQYGTATSYGSSTLISKPIGFDDNAAHLETAQISGLTPGATYHFRVVAINLLGTTYGPDQVFTTPAQPAVSAATASGVTSSTATLIAQINPELAATTYHFEYGPGLSYGSSTSESASIGADNAPHSVSAELGGLAPATTYHFRVVATNSFGSTTGVDQTFTTAEAPPLNIITPRPCKKGFVKKHGKCVKKPGTRAKHHKRGGKR